MVIAVAALALRTYVLLNFEIDNIEYCGLSVIAGLALIMSAVNFKWDPNERKEKK
nr:MAG TPA: hypothetical protein [Caudoviricetes sp.]